jgi:RecA/RadA recombinase
MEERESDVHNFSTSSEHRLPTISGAEALQNASIRAKGIATCLPALDSTLLPNSLPLVTPGIQIGHVTEVFGPPGVGKTTFGLQLAVNAIRSRRDESHVLWVNTGSPLGEERLDEINAAYTFPPNHDPPSSPPQDTVIGAMLDERFDYLEVTSLPRLLTLFLHPTHDLPSRETCLIIIDDFSNLVLGSFFRDPKTIKPTAPAAVQEKLAKRAAGKRFQIIESLAAAMSKLAALRNLAIVVLTSTTTNLKNGDQRGVLTPALASQAWESAVHTRIMLYRDFPPEDLDPDTLNQLDPGLRYADIQKLARKDVYARPVPFIILAGGLQELNLPDSANDDSPTNEVNGISERPSDPELPPLPLEIGLPERSMKRKINEIADSEDEDDSGFNHNEGEANGEEEGQAFFDENHMHEGDEPELPELPLQNRSGLSSDEDEDEDEDAGEGEGEEEEMILDAHETSLLRSYRRAIIRGSEDMEPLYSSDGEVGDGDDNEEDAIKNKLA